MVDYLGLMCGDAKECFRPAENTNRAQADHASWPDSYGCSKEGRGHSGMDELDIGRGRSSRSSAAGCVLRGMLRFMALLFAAVLFLVLSDFPAPPRLTLRLPDVGRSSPPTTPSNS